MGTKEKQGMLFWLLLGQFSIHKLSDKQTSHGYKVFLLQKPKRFTKTFDATIFFTVPSDFIPLPFLTEEVVVVFKCV